MPLLAIVTYHHVEASSYERISRIIRAARYLFNISGTPDVCARWGDMASVSVYCTDEQWETILDHEANGLGG